MNDHHKIRFEKTKQLFKKHARKAMSELNASKNPEKFMEDNKNMSIKDAKGVAF